MINFIKIIFEALIVGTIFLIIGNILFDLTINKKNLKTIKPFGLNIAFYATGFFTYLIRKIIVYMIKQC